MRQENRPKFLDRLAKGIVKARFAMYAVFAAAVALSALLIPKVNIEYDITSYLPKESQTRKALDIMEREFENNGSARAMLEGLTLRQELAAKAELEAIADENGDRAVSSVTVERRERDGGVYSLFTISMAHENGSPITERAVGQIREILSGYGDALLAGGAVHNTLFSEIMVREMKVILLVSLSIILLVLLFTSKSYMEIAVFLIVFGTAAVLNMGTNYFLGSISFVTNSIAVVLQLALAIDYAIIFSHRYTEEHARLPVGEAVQAALARSIPSILSSSLTTVAGLVALMFMQFRIGFDIGVVLAKGIVISFLTVFLLMPGLIMLFSKLIDKSRHRSFVPKVRFLGRFAVKSRKIVPIAVLCVIAAACALQSFNTFIFADTSYPTARKTQYALDTQRIDEIFGKDNLLAVVLPKGNPDAERAVLDYVGGKENVTSATGLAGIEIAEGVGYYDPIGPGKLAEIAGIGEGAARVLFMMYGKDRAPLSELLPFLAQNSDNPLITEEQKAVIDGFYAAARQLEGDEHARLVFTLDSGVESDASFALIADLEQKLPEYYGEFYLVGDSVSYYDISASFHSDVTKINLMTVFFILLILLANFRSLSLPVILILTIQGSIWINFAVSTVFGQPLLFMSYLIVSAIHMGATIDYAILITGRYREFKRVTDNRAAMIETLNAVFPTVITSASILTIAGLTVGGFSTLAYVFTIGNLLGRGTIVSMLMVLVVLPQLLLICDKLIDKTTLHKRDKKKEEEKGGEGLS